MTNPLRRQRLAEQTAAHLRAGFQSGRWVGKLPGVLQLTAELAVSDHIVRAALKLLEEEGWIESGGAGRSRRIVADGINSSSRRALRIGVMLYCTLAENDAHSATILLGVRNEIEIAGHVCVFSGQCLEQMKDNLTRIARCVKTADADAWIVLSGSRVVLEWFAAQPFPVFALGGRFHNLPVASSSTSFTPAVEAAVNALVDQGHRRIVMLIQTIFRKPIPHVLVENFMSILVARGIAATDYNIPHFDGDAESFDSCLDGLFRITPPTALLVIQAQVCTAVLSFLARRGLQVPRDVSVICMSPDPVFDWCLPPLDHFHAPREKLLTSITRWVNGVVKGRPDQRQSVIDAVYVPGGTIGPAKIR